MRPIKTFILLLFLCIANNSFSQTKITGTVLSENDSALAKATVILKDTRLNVTTDEMGRFSITSNGPKNTLIVSYVGYETETIVLQPNQAEIVIRLKIAQQQLSDAVVVGYGTQRKRDLTGSISSISSDQMNLGGVTSNVAQAIQGRAAGVQVSQGNKAPGGETTIRIRGGNSIKSTNEPLYVVDGFISSTGGDINPNDIEDIQILKDASATAIYGARGGNGIVMITTKRGKAGKASVQYEGYTGVQKITRKPDLLNGPDYMKITNDKAIENGNPPVYTPAQLASGINTDWFDLATRVASTQSHNLSISQAGDGSHFFLSGNYFKQNGSLKKTNYERYSFRLNVDRQIGKQLKVGGNIYVARSFSNFKTYDGNIVPSNVLFGITTYTPAIPAYDADGNYAKFNGRDNPIAWLLEPTNDNYGNKLNANVFAELEILKGLSFRVNGGTEYTTTKIGTYLPTSLVAGASVKGQASLTDNANQRNLLETYLTYKKQFGGSHSINVLAGFSRQRDITDGHYTQVQGFSTDTYLYYNLSAATQRLAPSSVRVQADLASYFGRLNYTFKDKYLATFTFRADGSSKFGSNNRYGYFPSGSLAWRMSDENFIKNLNTFSSLKLRAGYGITGNDRIQDYLSLVTYGPAGVSLGLGSDLYSGIYALRAANPNLKWEKTAQLDIGLDMGFMKGTINATIDYYNKKTTDLLYDIPLGQWTGFNSQTVNLGSMVNKGVELAISSTNINSRNFRWTTNFNIAYNKQKVLDLNGITVLTKTPNPDGGVPSSDFTKLEAGRELSMMFGYIYDGVIKSNETYAPQPTSKPGDPKYRDLDGDGLITAKDRTYIGNANPHYVLGLNNDFSYKGIELNVFFQGAYDYSLYNMTRLLLETYSGRDVLNRWTPQNQNTDIPSQGYFLSQYGNYINSRFVEKADYLRLKNVTLAYNLPVVQSGYLKKMQVKIYGSVQNAFTITNYTGSDPETVTRGGTSTVEFNSNLASGLDFNAYPTFRTFTAGVKITF